MPLTVPRAPAHSLITRHVYSDGRHKALIVQQHPAADGHVRETPWLLLGDTGRVDRFAAYAEAREEALKSWPTVTIGRA